MINKTNVAGVTFNNDAEDGGESRQTILKNLLKATTTGIITVDLKHVDFVNKDGETEDAIKCVEHSTKQVIGWIPRANIEATTERQVTGFIRYYKNKGYSCVLDTQMKPTQAQYHYIKSYCKANGIAMPAYDLRAYYSVFALITA